MKSKPAGGQIAAVMVTCGSRDQAEKLATGILHNRLAACVNILPAVESFFWWDGKIDNATEALMIIKIRRSDFTALEAFVRAHHAYEVPEIVMLPVEAVSQPYKKWVLEATKGKIAR